MRTVPDTNVLIASLISRGFCHELLEHCFLNHMLVTSEFILSEVKEKLVEKFKYSTETAEEAVALFRSRMEAVSPRVVSSLRIKTNLSNNKFQIPTQLKAKSKIQPPKRQSI